jgi:soluble lytic murein transglycosylase-like protein
MGLEAREMRMWFALALVAGLLALAPGAQAASGGALAKQGDGGASGEQGGMPALVGPLEGMPDVPYAAQIAGAADAYSIDRLLLTALVRQESNFQPRVTSRSGARGLTQLMPGTARMLGLRVSRRVDERIDPVLNLDAGARYLRQQLDTFRGVRLALAAYNAGPGAVRRSGGIPRYRETRQYVRLVLRHMAGYRTEMALAG